jgi:DivIVA domain-containing protein
MDPVSAEEARDVTFRTTRLRAGYDMAEVDAFLDRVEKTLADLTRNLADARDSQTVLRAQCDQLRTRMHAERPTDTRSLAGADETLVLTTEIRNRVRRMLSEQLALLDD